MVKIIVYDEEVCCGFEWGLNVFVDVVKVILGFKGCNVVLEKKWGVFMIINDGVFIVKEIELEDLYEKIGVELVKEVVKKIDDVVGDGIMMVIVLVQVLVCEGLCNVVVGVNLFGFKCGIEKVVEKVIEILFKGVKEVEIKEQIVVIVVILVGDQFIGDLIVEVMDKVGNEGVIIVEEFNMFGLQFEFIEGMWFDKGYILGYFVIDLECQEVVLEDFYILLVSFKVFIVKDLLLLFEKVIGVGKLLLIIVEDVEGEVLFILVVNKICGIFKLVVVKVFGFGDCCKVMLQDMVIFIGGQVISEEVGLMLENVDLLLLGKVCKVVVIKDEIIIVEGVGDIDVIVG